MTTKRHVSAALCLFTISALVLIGVSNASAASPSFGYVSVGDQSSATFGGVFVSNFTSPADVGTITRLNVYLATGGTTAKAVIYSDKDGAPDALLAQSDAVSVDGTAGRWVSFDMSYAGTPNTPYWLGVVFSSAGTYYYALGVGGKALYSFVAVEAPATLSGGTLSLNDSLSVYADYTPASASSATPAPQTSGWAQTALLVVAVVGVGVAVVVAAVFAWNRQRAKPRQ